MSSLTTNFTTYRIALFQGGLGDNGNCFTETINNLDRASSKVINSGEQIDMRHFNPNNQSFYRTDANGYYSKSTIAHNDFDAQVARIVELAKNNVGKTIMVRTFLNRGFNVNHNLDSIDNQKNKLCYIIDAFKKYSNVEIILVGHSQGGVVNLETATARSNQISRMISICTPYAPVCLAETLVFLNFMYSLFSDSCLYSEFVNDDRNIPAYKSCVEKLSSSAYFNDLKARWDALSTRPKLTVITGTSGHLIKVIPGIAVEGYYSPDTIYKEPFDGLVTVEEQTAISHANFIHLVNNTIPCYTERKYAQSICSTQVGATVTCKNSCPLSSISISGTVMDVITKYVQKALTGDPNLDYLTVKDAIFAGLARNEANCPAGYEEYYKIYANAFNHDHIRYNSTTTGHLAVLLTT